MRALLRQGARLPPGRWSTLLLLTAAGLGEQPPQDACARYDGQLVLQFVACRVADRRALLAELEAADCRQLGERAAPARTSCVQTAAACPHDLPPALLARSPAVLGQEAGDALRRGGLPQHWHGDPVREGHASDTGDFYSQWRPLQNIEERLRELVSTSNGAATLEGLRPLTVEGREILLVRIRDPAWEPGKPRVVLNAAQHAREWISVMVGMYLAEFCIRRKATDPTWLEGVELVIVPVCNPDGVLYSQTYDKLWRKNRRVNQGSSCRGVDLNRNWDTDWNGTESTSQSPCSDIFVGSSARSEPETQALAKVIQEAPVTAHLDIHSFAAAILGPWSYTDDEFPRKAEMEKLGLAMQSAMQAVNGVTYVFGSGDEVLYLASGVLPDYTSSLGALGYTVELPPATWEEGGFTPPPQSILPCAREVLQGVYTLMDWVSGADADDMSTSTSTATTPTVCEDDDPGVTSAAAVLGVNVTGCADVAGLCDDGRVGEILKASCCITCSPFSALAGTTTAVTDAECEDDDSGIAAAASAFSVGISNCSEAAALCNDAAHGRDVRAYCCATCTPPACGAHSECPRRMFCAEWGRCALCEECLYCDNGVGSTCGSCGVGFPTQENSSCKACSVHTECPRREFCAAIGSLVPPQHRVPRTGKPGRCALCEVCRYCRDGVDSSCGLCGAAFPTQEGNCSACRDFQRPGNGKWYDADDFMYDCEWYAQADNCEQFGDGFDNFGRTASEACCACGGGADPWVPTPAPTTLEPTPAPPPTPVRPCEPDDPSRRRSGLPCDEMTTGGDSSCMFAPQSRRRDYGGQALDTCQTTCSPYIGCLAPTPPPTPCVDWTPPGKPSWYDSYYYDCADFVGVCDYYGSCCSNFGHTANEACCICGGGVDPTAPSLVPTPAPTPIVHCAADDPTRRRSGLACSELLTGGQTSCAQALGSRRRTYGAEALETCPHFCSAFLGCAPALASFSLLQGGRCREPGLFAGITTCEECAMSCLRDTRCRFITTFADCASLTSTGYCYHHARGSSSAATPCLASVYALQIPGCHNGSGAEPALGKEYPCLCGSGGAICEANELCAWATGECTLAACSVGDGVAFSDAYPCRCGAAVCIVGDLCIAELSACGPPTSTSTGTTSTRTATTTTITATDTTTTTATTTTVSTITTTVTTGTSRTVTTTSATTTTATTTSATTLTTTATTATTSITTTTGTATTATTTITHTTATDSTTTTTTSSASSTTITSTTASGTTTTASSSITTTTATTTTATTTTVTDTSTATANAVMLQMRLAGLDYSGLVSDDNIRVSFEQAVIGEVARAADVADSLVSLRLVPGSVLVQAVIAVPGGSSGARVMQGVKSPELGASVVSAVSALPDIDVISDGGTLQVLDVVAWTPPRTTTTRTTTTAVLGAEGTLLGDQMFLWGICVCSGAVAVVLCWACLRRGAMGRRCFGGELQTPSDKPAQQSESAFEGVLPDQA